MKKYLILASAVLFTLAACEKQSEIINPIDPNKEVVLTFTSERPQLDDIDTKTAWDDASSSIVWVENDKIRVGYTFGGTWMGQKEAGDAKFYQSDAVEIDGGNASVGTFKVPISGSAFTDPETEGDYVFYAIYPNTAISSTTVADAPNATVTLKASQEPKANSFDSSTDLLVGKTATMPLSGLPTDAIELIWDRVVAHGYFTLKDFQGVEDGETITKVTLTAQDGANLAGEEVVSLEDGTVTASDATNEIVLSGANLAFVNETIDGVEMTNLKVWLSTIPVTLSSLKVDVATSKANYVREITGISKTLKKNARNKLAINMSSATKTQAEQVEWVKKDLSSITSSDVFVIVGNNGSANFAMSNDKGTTNPPTATSIAVSGNKLAANPIDNIQWNLSGNATDGYIFYPNGTTEIWLYCTATNNGVRVGTNNNKVFTLDASSGYLKHIATSRYVGIYNSADWRCYTSAGGNIANQTFSFYVKTAAGEEPTLQTPTLTFSEPTTTVNIGETVTNTATIDPSTLSVTYTSSDEDVATVDENGTVTGVAVGSATISASFAGNDSYEAVSTSYEITVVNPNGNNGSADKPYLASEAAALALNGSTAEVYVKGIISNITAAYNAQYNNVSFAITDDGLSSSTQFVIYRATASSANDYKVGDYVVFKGNLTTYNSTPELASGNTKITQVHAPTLSPESGSASSVTITADDGATIRYTTDGINPTTTTGAVYSSAITITANTTIKAIAVLGDVVTGVVSGTYTPASANDKTASFIFNTDEGIAALGITKPSAGEGTELGTGTYSSSDVSMVNATAEGKTETRVWNSNGTLDLRIYTGSTLTFSVEGTITSIVLSGATVGGFTVDSGSFSSGTWTGSASSVKFTATSTEKINTITVTYK